MLGWETCGSSPIRLDAVLAAWAFVPTRRGIPHECVSSCQAVSTAFEFNSVGVRAHFLHTILAAVPTSLGPAICVCRGLSARLLQRD